jgi:alkylation response protein AidB-like acyl-CoA dehydrogenase
MIDFELPEELALLVETAKSFAAAELRPREREHETARGVSDEAARRFREIGLAGLELPEAHGGAALGALARALALEELAFGDPGAALALDPLGPALYPIAETGGSAALREFAQPLVDAPGARAVLVTSAQPLPAPGSPLTLSVPWVPADRADLVVVLSPEGACAVRDGIRLEKLRGAGLRAAGASALELADAPVAALWRDPRGARRALTRARLYVTGLLVGTMRASAEYSRAYAQQREAFGRPIAHHQALAFLIADMASAVDGLRLLVHDAALRLDRGEPAEAACAAAFAEAAEQAGFVAPNAVQILGGHGFMQDYPVEKWMRDARALSLLYGGPDPARDDAGRALAAEDEPLALARGRA